MRSPSTKLKLYNTLSRQKENFRPLNKSKVSLYTCGPTVYNFAHIGNLRTYIFEDILERTLLFLGFNVKRVMNITDVGHLTNDSDEGEDKMEQEAHKEKKDVLEVAHIYTEAFLNDIKKLNIKIPKIIAPATKFIPEQQKLIQKLFEKGLAYETKNAVYFDVTRYGLKKYLRLSRQPIEEKRIAVRAKVVKDPEKKHPSDFALWFKITGKFKNHVLQWDSPWEKGFPGWHIECSAISEYFLKQPFDIHTGGIDHIAVHHTNEMAQSEGAYNKELAHFWLHGEFLVINNERMGKSLGNFLTLRKIEDRSLPPLAYRYFILGAHYRSQLNFHWEALESSNQSLQNLYKQVGRLIFDARQSKMKILRHDYEKKFLTALSDDLNTPQALASLHALLYDDKLSPVQRLDTAKKFDKVLQLSLIETARKRMRIPFHISVAKKHYHAFRRNQQFVQSDTLRKRLNALGYGVEDTPYGPFLWPIKQK
ncbi:MAG: cysteine--tRNA ligase [Patescibacteria group bacterium]|nr:cysteine--tRNA ligase [Patescibacteria group bacterium]